LCDVVAIQNGLHHGPSEPAGSYECSLPFLARQCRLDQRPSNPQVMASTVYGERNGIRARFQLHHQSSDENLRVALKLAEQQQRLLRNGRTARRTYADIEDKTYNISRQNAKGARSRKKISPDPIPRRDSQDSEINRQDRRYSFSSEDRKQEALLGPIPMVTLSSYEATTVPTTTVNPPSHQRNAVPTNKTRPNLQHVLSPKEQRKSDKRSQKELEGKVKQARKMVEADIKDKAKKSRKRLKATYKAASSNPDGFVAWAEAYQKLAGFPAAEATPVIDSANGSQPRSSMQWLKALLPRRLIGSAKPPAYNERPIPTVPELPAAELSRSELRPSRPAPQPAPERPVDGIYELGGNGWVDLSLPDNSTNQAGASAKGKSKAMDISNQESSENALWTTQLPGTAHSYPLQDLSFLDSTLAESSNSWVKALATPIPKTPFSEAGTMETVQPRLTRENHFLRDEIGRLGAQAAAKLRQCAAEMEQAEELRNAELKRALSVQHRRHAQELEKFTAALKMLQDPGRKEPRQPVTGGHTEHKPPGEVLEPRDHIVARREYDLALRLQEVSLREREAVLREREAASREREAASRERQAASVAAEASSELQQATLQERSWPQKNQPISLQETRSPIETIAHEPRPGPSRKDLSLRLRKRGSAGETDDASKSLNTFPMAQPRDPSVAAARNALGSGDGTGKPLDYREPHALHQLTRILVDRLITSLFPFKSIGFKNYAVPKRKSASSATLAKPSRQSRPRTGSFARQRVDKGKGRESSDDEADSDTEPRKRRRHNPQTQNLPPRILACPYSKYDICRYSEMNILEKCYRGCTSCYLTDIPRLK
jgi:hypothetical protein